jgi:hypothetical protein
MDKWNRREFLAAMTSAGVSSYAAWTGWTDNQKIKGGIGTLTPHSLRMSVLMREIPQVNIAAIVRDSDKTRWARTDWEAAFPDGRPRMYPSVSAMLEQCPLDFLYASGISAPLAQVPVHLLLDDFDPARFRDFSKSSKCVQVLPQYEFASFGPVGSSISGEWARAIVDCRCPLPPTPFANRAEFASWLYRQVGEAIEVAQALMKTDDLRQVFAAATPGASPYEAKFGWRFVGKNLSSIVDLSVVAVHSGEPSRTKITLRSQRQSVSVSSAPRSAELTRFLIWNFLESIRQRKPENLLYDPRNFSRSWTLVSYAAESI